MSLSGTDIQTALQRAKELAATTKENKRHTSAGGPDSDDFEEPAHKRPTINGDMSMGGMDMMAGNGAVEVLEVPNNTVGLIIGRGGEQIQTIQTQSGCRVQMAPDSEGGQTRQCTLSGTPETIMRAKQLVMEIIARAGNRNSSTNGGSMGGGGMGQFGNGFGSAGGQEPLGPGQINFDYPIPTNRVGLVIGKGGETIKNLQLRSGVKMVMIQESSAPGVGSKILRMTGDPDKIENAKQLVNEVINSRQGDSTSMGGGAGRTDFGNGIGGASGGSYMAGQFNKSSGQISIGEVIVPRSSVGMIIGKGGENIKRMAMESGAKIQFKQDEDPNGPERTAIIQGSLDSIQKATHLITQCVTKSESATQDTFYMHVPANKTGLVIGRGGETIKALNAEAGAHVELSRDPQPNPDEKVFVIKGSPYQIHCAQHLIRIKVGDIAPGTPIPPMPGGQMGDTTHSQFGAQGGYNMSTYQQQPQAQAQWGGQQAQQAQTYGGAQQGGDAWAAYYAQQNVGGGAPAQQYGAAAGGQQAFPGGGGSNAAPAINPQTGQPDYSAQWIEYYRSLGMHEQAQMIEQQARQARGAGGAPAAGGGAAPQASYGQQAQPPFGGGGQQQYQQAYHH